MTTMPMTAVVIVTHDSHHYIHETIASIAHQSLAPDITIAIDDFSTDGTPDALASQGFSVHCATSSSVDTTTRIAQNFQQGLRAAVVAGADLVILGDHDDIWHRDRIQHQVAALEQQPEVAMLASDGYLIDEHGAAVPGTIRSTFPVPTDFTDQPLRSQLAYALRHSLATGGASALRPAAMQDWSVPPGWLHDRWWSLAALRARALSIDPTAVIDYRLSSGQQVGLERADQHETRRWTFRKITNAGATAAKASDLSRLLTRKITPPRSTE